MCRNNGSVKCNFVNCVDGQFLSKEDLVLKSIYS